VGVELDWRWWSSFGVERRASVGLLRSWGVLRVEDSLFCDGDLALFAESMNQCLIDAS